MRLRANEIIMGRAYSWLRSTAVRDVVVVQYVVVGYRRRPAGIVYGVAIVFQTQQVVIDRVRFTPIGVVVGGPAAHSGQASLPLGCAGLPDAATISFAQPSSYALL